MQVENIDIDALISLTKQTVFAFKDAIDDNDESESKAKDALIGFAHDTICNQVKYILGIHSKKEFSDMREALDERVCRFIDGNIGIDDLIRFIQNLYIELLNMESEELDKRTKSILEKKTIMIGRQCMGH